MSTHAKERFDSVMQRCDELLETCKKGILPQNICDDVLRAVVVYSVAALDAYASDRFFEKFTCCLSSRQHPRAIVDLVEESGLSVAKALALLSEKKPYQVVKQLVVKHFETSSRQSFDSIDDLYKYLGLNGITGSALSLSKRKMLRSRIQHMLNRRHRIVHEGDYNGRHRLADISASDVERWVKATRVFVSSMEKIVEQRFSRGKKRANKRP